MKTEQKSLSELAKERLTKRELGYFQIINGQYLVLMLKARPATWKSAILKSIADKLEMVFIDLRLPQMDEVDLGAYPVVMPQTIKTGDSVTSLPVIRLGIPEWAMATLDKTKNFLIVFEELNRTSTAVRNAALGLLLERRIGPNFVLGDNVYMAATGNLGTSDGTEVEEFDNALKSRLIPVMHPAEFTTWLEDFAETIRDKSGKIIKQGMIHEDIVDYLKSDPTAFYPEEKEQGGATNTGDVITCPRTWTALSVAIQRNFGMNSKVDDYRSFLQAHGSSYIGPRALRFLRFLDENITITFDDVLKGKVKDVTKIKRDNKSEILRVFEKFDPNTLKYTKKDTDQFDRMIVFLKSVDHDLLTGAIYQYGVNRYCELNGKQTGGREREIAKIFEKEFAFVVKQEDEDQLKATENEEKNQPKAK